MSVIKKVLNFFKQKSTSWKGQVILNHLSNKETVLDFGCGDLSLASYLKKKRPDLNITGVDVIKFENSFKDISFIQYDGKILPFKDNSFDTVISFYVFHHCVKAEEAFKECFRVAKKRVLFVEAISTYPLEVYCMGFIDWFFNVWKLKRIPLTFQFFTLEGWSLLFKKLSIKDYTKEELTSRFFSWLPVGRAYIFNVYKK